MANRKRTSFREWQRQEQSYPRCFLRLGQAGRDHSCQIAYVQTTKAIFYSESSNSVSLMLGSVIAAV